MKFIFTFLNDTRREYYTINLFITFLACLLGWQLLCGAKICDFNFYSFALIVTFILLYVVGFCAVIIFKIFTRGVVKLSSLNIFAKIKRLEKENHILQQENKKLKEEIIKLKQQLELTNKKQSKSENDEEYEWISPFQVVPKDFFYKLMGYKKIKKEKTN